MASFLSTLDEPQAPPLQPVAGELSESGRPRAFQGLTGALVSVLVHALLLITLALWIFQPPATTRLHVAGEWVEPLEEELSEQALVEIATLEGAAAWETANTPETAHTPDASEIPSPLAGPDQPASLPTTILESLPTPAELLAKHRASQGGGYQGRTRDARARLVGQRGGTAGSEAAVDIGLRWLIAHQHPDGGWRLDRLGEECDGRCSHPGTAGGSTAATALGLLPFLGAGHTAATGEHREVVDRGIRFLVGRILETSHGGDLQEGSMYSQGLATIALCEHLAMTGDESLRAPAQSAVDFICHAQHPKGGWRYVPGQPGDTTVSGWQLMALKSAQLAGLRVPSPVIEQAKEFLDSVQVNDGAQYGYLPGKAVVKKPGPTAVGLLCRMYTGWPRDEERLAKGVDYLAALGPSDHDMYFNYYATQVLHHYQGPHWDRWNTKLREQLIRTQSAEGHERGSWHFEDEHGDVGGRLYTTAMCIMVLEVYYRHMPLYGEQSVE